MSFDNKIKYFSLIVACLVWAGSFFVFAQAAKIDQEVAGEEERIDVIEKDEKETDQEESDENCDKDEKEMIETESTSDDEEEKELEETTKTKMMESSEMETTEQDVDQQLIEQMGKQAAEGAVLLGAQIELSENEQNDKEDANVLLNDEQVAPSNDPIEEDKSEANRSGDVLVVVNELAWMGTENSPNDEWIELKNMDDEEVSLEGWKLQASDGSPKIELKGKISSGGYYLLERTNDDSAPGEQADLIYTGALGNGGESLVLENENGDKVDELDFEDGWPAGQNSSKLTMERKGDGSWKNSEFAGGTPKKKNSEAEGSQGNDPGPIEPSYDLGNVLINELLPDPSGSDVENEWIEILNREERDLSLLGWSIKDLSGKTYSFPDQKIEVGGFAILSYVQTKISLNNTGDQIQLLDPNGVIVSETEYEKSPGSDVSWSRKSDGTFDWTWILTPGKENGFPQKKEYSKDLHINEILANPEGTDKGNEWIELANVGSEDVALEGWYFQNGSGKIFVIGGGFVEKKGIFLINLKDTSFTLRNSNLELMLFNPNGELSDKIGVFEYAKTARSYNFDGRRWSWSRFPTPNKINQINNLPILAIKKDKKTFRDIYAEFDAKKSYDPDGEKLSFRWDFGDGHRSYLRTTRHKYDKTGSYKASIEISDGAATVRKEFKVEVKKFPRYELEFVKLLPNPDGVDRENEQIVILNREGKKINLEGYYIATGRNKKQSVRHPIYDDFVVGPGKTKTIRNDKLCRFSLRNSKGVVLLLTPDGREVFSIKYQKDKIAIGETFEQNETGQWEWILPRFSFDSGESSREKIRQANFSEGVFQWFNVTKNEKLKICEVQKIQKISNWIVKEETKLRILEKIFGIKFIPFDWLS